MVQILDETELASGKGILSALFLLLAFNFTALFYFLQDWNILGTNNCTVYRMYNKHVFLYSMSVLVSQQMMCTGKPHPPSQWFWAIRAKFDGCRF